MQNPRVGVGFVAVIQIPQNRFQYRVSCVKPLAHILPRGEFGVPVCGIVVVWGSFDFGMLYPRGHFLVRFCASACLLFRVL